MRCGKILRRDIKREIFLLSWKIIFQHVRINQKICHGDFRELFFVISSNFAYQKIRLKNELVMSCLRNYIICELKLAPAMSNFRFHFILASALRHVEQHSLFPFISIQHIFQFHLLISIKFSFSSFVFFLDMNAACNLNWLLHKMYLIRDFEFCKKLIEQQMEQNLNREYLFFIKVGLSKFREEGASG